MGIRGPIKEYPKLIQLSVTDSQDEFIGELATLQEVTKPEAVRRLIDVAFAEALVKEAFRG